MRGDMKIPRPKYGDDGSCSGGRRGEEREAMSGRNAVLQCSVNKIGGEQLLSTAESSIDHSHGKLQQQGASHIYCSHISRLKDSPVALSLFYSIKPKSFS